MSSSFDSQDRRAMRVRVRLIRFIRFVPGLQGLVDIVMSSARRAIERKAIEYQGIRLHIRGLNGDLYREHIQTALDLLADYAPVYLRWLRRSFRLLVVNQAFKKSRSVTDEQFGSQMLAVHPYTVWHDSSEQLAVYIASSATWGRVGPRLRNARLTKSFKAVLSYNFAISVHCFCFNNSKYDFEISSGVAP